MPEDQKMYEFDVWTDTEGKVTAVKATARLVDDSDAPYGYSHHALRVTAANKRSAIAEYRARKKSPGTKTARFLESFQSVAIRAEHRNHGDETPCLRDCGIPPAIATKLIQWAENDVGTESLVCTFEYRNSGRNMKTWHWMPEFLREAFRKHTELFGDADLPEAARRMRDTGSCFL